MPVPDILPQPSDDIGKNEVVDMPFFAMSDIFGGDYSSINDETHSKAFDSDSSSDSLVSTLISSAPSWDSASDCGESIEIKEDAIGEPVGLKKRILRSFRRDKRSLSKHDLKFKDDSAEEELVDGGLIRRLANDVAAMEPVGETRPEGHEDRSTSSRCDDNTTGTNPAIQKREDHPDSLKEDLHSISQDESCPGAIQNSTQALEEVEDAPSPAEGDDAQDGFLGILFNALLMSNPTEPIKNQKIEEENNRNMGAYVESDKMMSPNPADDSGHAIGDQSKKAENINDRKRPGQRVLSLFNRSRKSSERPDSDVDSKRSFRSARSINSTANNQFDEVAEIEPSSSFENKRTSSFRQIWSKVPSKSKSNKKLPRSTEMGNSDSIGTKVITDVAAVKTIESTTNTISDSNISSNQILEVLPPPQNMVRQKSILKVKNEIDRRSGLPVGWTLYPDDEDTSQGSIDEKLFPRSFGFRRENSKRSQRNIFAPKKEEEVDRATPDQHSGLNSNSDAPQDPLPLRKKRSRIGKVKRFFSRKKREKSLHNMVSDYAEASQPKPPTKDEGQQTEMPTSGDFFCGISLCCG